MFPFKVGIAFLIILSLNLGTQNVNVTLFLTHLFSLITGVMAVTSPTTETLPEVRRLQLNAFCF